MDKDNVVVIIGPTAVGKTQISIELAKRLDGEIVSADSMQIYKYLDIGTAKPTLEEMQGINHYMIDIIEPEEEFSVARYKDMALECIEKIINNKKIPIIVGGTGLYVNSITDNIEFSETKIDWSYRNQLQAIAQSEGSDVLYKELEEVDREAADRIHPKDIRRIIRALEVYKYTGKPISFHQQISKKNPPRFKFLKIGLSIDRDKLYERINQRVDYMIEKGLVEEVKKILDKGININSISMQGLGYKEMVDYYQGSKTLDEVIEIIKRDSRRYAKRQLTWFRRDPEIYWIDIKSGQKEVLKKIFIYLEANGMFM